jgi:hypothetical protein
LNSTRIANSLTLGSAALGLSLTLGGCKNTPSESEGKQVTSSRTQTAEVLSSNKPEASAPSAAASGSLIDAGAKTAESAEPEKKPISCWPKVVKLEGVNVISREKWGAKPADLEVLGTMPNCSNFPINKITIHHTGEAKETVPGQETMRLQSAQTAHMKLKHWGDFAYHYAIGLSGEIYEGRNPAFRGDSNTQYYPGRTDRSHTPEHHLLITVIGNYEIQEMTEATRRSLSQLISVNLSRYHLNQADVITHKSVAYTGCPGKNVIEWLNQRGSGPKPAETTELLPKIAPSTQPTSVPRQ